MSAQEPTRYGFPEAHPPGDKSRAVNTLSDISPQALADLITYLSGRLTIPVNQVLGFTQFAPQQASVSPGPETTASTTYTNLATVGPSLSNLADGKYLVIVAARIDKSTVTSGAVGYMSVSPNGATPTDDDAASFSDANTTGNYIGVTVTAPSVQTLKSGNNSLVAKYRSSDALTTMTFDRRRLVAIRISNP